MKKETINVTYLSPMTKVVEIKVRGAILSASGNPGGNESIGTDDEVDPF